MILFGNLFRIKVLYCIHVFSTIIFMCADCFGGQTPLKRDLIARKAKRDEDRARKAEEERKKREQEDLLDQQRKVMPNSNYDHIDIVNPLL